MRSLQSMETRARMRRATWKVQESSYGAISPRSSRRCAPGSSTLSCCRSRLPKDGRLGRGQPEGEASFRIDFREAGGFGLLNVFCTADELAALIEEHLGQLQRRQRLFLTFDNPQGGIVVRDADVIIWGRVPAS
jgi:hypothetical protein